MIGARRSGAVRSLQATRGAETVVRLRKGEWQGLSKVTSSPTSSVVHPTK